MERDPYKVQEIRTLKRQPDESTAMKLLRDACHQVQPIMRKRQWRVPLVAEFSPRNPNLLGLNIGGGGGSTKEIRVRLRPAGREAEFYPYDHILGTLLHELTHNIHGPHNALFYKLLEEITAECEDLLARGVAGSGAGFDAASEGRLGSHAFIPTHNPPAHKLREVALQARSGRCTRWRRRRQPGLALALHPGPAQHSRPGGSLRLPLALPEPGRATAAAGQA